MLPKIIQIHEIGSPQGPPNPFKKNRQKSMPVPSGDLLAAPGYPWMSQMATQGLIMMQTGIKNGAQTTHLATKVETGGRGGALRSFYIEI